MLIYSFIRSGNIEGSFNNREREMKIINLEGEPKYNEKTPKKKDVY